MVMVFRSPRMEAPSYIAYTTADGLGDDNINGVFALGSTIYTANYWTSPSSRGENSISGNGGSTWTTYSTANSNLPTNYVNSVYSDMVQPFTRNWFWAFHLNIRRRYLD